MTFSILNIISSDKDTYFTYNLIVAILVFSLIATMSGLQWSGKFPVYPDTDPVPSRDSLGNSV